MDDKNGQSGYYQEIARAFLERRGGPFYLSPKDQATIAAWEEQRIPLRVVLEGICRTFDALKARGRGTKTISLAFCGREVEAAFAQHRDRAAGRRRSGPAGPRTDKRDKALREIARALEALPAGDAEMKLLLEAARQALSVARPDAAELERIDAAIEAALWAGATEAEKAEAEAEARQGPRSGKPAAPDEEVLRRAIMTARARRRVPHVALHYY
jgi:hypothetical protein